MEFEVVSGKSISRCCKHIFAETEVINGSVVIKKDYSIFEKLQPGDSIFVKTDCLPVAFHIMKGINTTIKIVTHESDYVINDDIVSVMPKSVDRLYSINCITSSNKVVPIPLGIANDYCKITLKPTKIKDLSVNSIKALIACNTQNNLTERAPLYQHKFDEEVTVVRDSLSLIDYESIVKQHDFVFCPEGNGPDTHRIWETLYMGKIPIVKTAVWNRNFRDLPIMFVDYFVNANKEMRERCLSQFMIATINREKLDTLYWEKLINEC